MSILMKHSAKSVKTNITWKQPANIFPEILALGGQTDNEATMFLSMSQCVHWNGDLVEARHYYMHHVFSAKHTGATDFFLNMWYDSIEKKMLFLQNLSRKY